MYARSANRQADRFPDLDGAFALCNKSAMASGDISYSDLTEQAHACLTSARKAVDSMRHFLVKHQLLGASATVAEFVRTAIACQELRIRELSGQQEALGVGLGDELARRLGWSWMCVTDAWGEALAVVAPAVTAQAYPLDWVGKRLDEGDDFEDAPEWFEQVVTTCMEMAAEAGPRR